MESTDYTTRHLLDICGVDNGWAADELARRIAAKDAALMRASTVLAHMAVERCGWRRYLFGRWMIPDETLRADARATLPVIGRAVRGEEKT